MAKLFKLWFFLAATTSLLTFVDCEKSRLIQSSTFAIKSFKTDKYELKWSACAAESQWRPTNSSYLAVVNSRHVYKLTSTSVEPDSNELTLEQSVGKVSRLKCESIALRKSLLPSVGSHVIALYLSYNHGESEQTESTEMAELLYLQTVDISSQLMHSASVEKEIDKDNTGISNDWAAASRPIAGILYSTWHAQLGAGQMQECAHEAKLKNSTCPTTEYVIQNSTAGTDSIRIKDLQSAYSVTPKKGFYCIYRKRPDEAGLLPDCPNITETLTQHASELLSAGIDYVALDATNLDHWPDNHSDTIQLRPTEVLFEEWAKLRKSGVNTPKIVVWNLAANGSVLWKQYLDRLYNNADQFYQDLLLVNKKTGKKVFMVTDNNKGISPDVLSAIESNGGRNDIDVIKVWADIPPQKYSSGTWGFFTPCGGETYSTTVQSMTECNQLLTSNSPMGTAIAISPSYQTGYASAPFQSPSALGGFTFKIQFATGLKKMPDNFFLSSYNEFITGPRQDAFGGPEKHPYVTSVGLEWDPDRYSGWVDTYGAFRSRNIEPTEEYGDMFYDIMSSCFRVASLNAANGKVGCNIAGEECCNIRSSQLYKPIWSLSTVTGTPSNKTDFLFTDSESEREKLTGQSGGYREICAVLGAQATSFCQDNSLSEGIDAARGPFIVFSQNGTDRVALYRCMRTEAHFFSQDKTCEGAGKMEILLGWTSSKRNSQTARSLHRCQALDKNSNHTYYFPMLDNSCPQGTVGDHVVGYVV